MGFWRKEEESSKDGKQEPLTVEESVLDELERDAARPVDAHLNEADADDTAEPEASPEDAAEATDNSAAFNEVQAELLRVKADLQNAHRIKREEVAKAKKFGPEKLARDLIELADTFDLALENVPEKIRSDEEAGPWLEGIEMMRGQLTTIFEKHGVTQMEIEKGVTAFDPKFHQAVARVEIEDGSDVKPGTIVEIGKNGYTMHGRILRTAAVAVSAAKP